MNAAELEAGVRQAMASESWPEFQGYLAPLELRMLHEEGVEEGESARALIEVDRRFAQDLLDGAEIATTVLTDFFSKMIAPTTLRLGAGHLADIERSGFRDSAQQEGRLRQWQNAVAGVARHLGASGVALADSDRGVLQRALRASEPSDPATSERRPFRQGNEISMPAGTFQLQDCHGLNSGDIVFREMNIPLLKILRSFGHAGVYIGVAAGGALNGQPVVVEMQMTRKGGECRVVTFADFKRAGGAGGYWGGYTVDLDPPERYQVVVTALSYVGVAKYGFVNHKDPLASKFRCDGLAEHCYEALKPTPARLLHRGGLFEEDLWSSMSPASLRSCMFRKIP